MKYKLWLIVGVPAMVAVIDSIYEKKWAPLPLVIAIAAFILALTRGRRHCPAEALSIVCRSSALTFLPAPKREVELSDMWLEISVRNTLRQAAKILRITIELSPRLLNAIGDRQRLRVLPDQQDGQDLELPLSIETGDVIAIFLMARFYASLIDVQLQRNAIEHLMKSERIFLILGYTQGSTEKSVRRKLYISTDCFKMQISNI